MEKRDMTIMSAERFLSAPAVDTSIDLEVYGVLPVFEQTRARLIKCYGDVKVIADGVAAQLNSLTRADVIQVPAQPDYNKQRYNALDAMRVTARLTRQEDGCPWDKAQTHESIRINLIEEAYEAVDAIDNHDIANMREEFGDVLLQSLLQSDIARRAGEFDFDDVCDELCKKLIGRHTFIFGGDSAGNPDEALTLWEKAKATEKNYDSVKSQLQRLPTEFPSLLRCQKAYKKMKKAGAAADPQKQLDAALKAKDYVAAIAALCGLLAEEGKDAEVELNRVVRETVDKL